MTTIDHKFASWPSDDLETIAEKFALAVLAKFGQLPSRETVDWFEAALRHNLNAAHGEFGASGTGERERGTPTAVVQDDGSTRIVEVGGSLAFDVINPPRVQARSDLAIVIQSCVDLGYIATVTTTYDQHFKPDHPSVKIEIIGTSAGV